MQRREFLVSCVVVATPVFGCSESDPDAADATPFDETLFPQSVASGDPRPDRVVLWTRLGGAGSPKRREALLEVATDANFEHRLRLDARVLGASGAATASKAEQFEVSAEPQADYCVRVRVEGLEPDTEYYYRFVVDKDGTAHRSRTGRTRTAPAVNSNAKVRFLVMSCQDYGGRYYHALRRAVALDAHFVVHLGDYVYETSGDPDFQSVDAERAMRFSDRDGALQFDAPVAPMSGAMSADEPERQVLFLAARSLDNYRELYRTVRTDPDLQRLHERFPFIVTWDDHEFSDDCWGQNSTYLADQRSELDPERRSNADQAWFEYMPVDYLAGADFEFDPKQSFPENLRIYRDFTFGKHLHLVMTDLRRFRSDHVIPEAAHPALIAVPEPRLVELLGELPSSAEPYLDFGIEPGASLAQALQDAAGRGFAPSAELLQPSELSGALAVASVQALIDAHNVWTEDEPLPALDVEDPSLPRGVSYGGVGKLNRYSSFGSRYFVNPETFAIVALDRYQATEGGSEQVMGDAQESWFVQTLTQSDSTWKVWGNPYTLSTREVDLSSILLEDRRLSRRFSLSADDWSGFPNRRKKLLEGLAGVDNLVVVTGDSHSFFASRLGLPAGNSVLEFVCGAISSSTYRAALERGIGGMPAVAGLAPLAGTLIQQANPELAFQNIEDNGFALLVASSSELEITFFQIPHARLSEPLPATPEAEATLLGLFKQQTLRVRAGQHAIERKTEDGYETWDPSTQSWGT